MEGFAAASGLLRKRRPVPLRALSPAAITAVLAAGATLLVVSVPGLHFAYRTPELRVALETTAALVATLTAGLVYGRFRRSSRLDDLLLAVALGLLAQTNLCFAAGPPPVPPRPAPGLSSRAAPLCQPAGA